MTASRTDFLRRFRKFREMYALPKTVSPDSTFVQEYMKMKVADGFQGHPAAQIVGSLEQSLAAQGVKVDRVSHFVVDFPHTEPTYEVFENFVDGLNQKVFAAHRALDYVPAAYPLGLSIYVSGDLGQHVAAIKKNDPDVAARVEEKLGITSPTRSTVVRGVNNTSAPGGPK